MQIYLLLQQQMRIVKVSYKQLQIFSLKKVIFDEDEIKCNGTII